MNMRITKLLAIALAGTMLSAAPGFAAPPMGGNGGNGGSGGNGGASSGQPKCMIPGDPTCPAAGRHHRGNNDNGSSHGNSSGNSGKGSNGSNGSGSGNGGSGSGNNADNNGGSGNNGGSMGRGSNDNMHGSGDNNGSDHHGQDNGQGNGSDHGRHGHPSFHNWMHSFHFPTFARPFFDVRPGIVVPRSYRLRHVPPEILWYYPEYAGFFYFIGRHGEIVIVSPRSLRIVAVLN